MYKARNVETMLTQELVGQFFKRFDDIDNPNGYVTLPYINRKTDALRRILQK